MNNIKSMKLYTHVGRIENELAELGYGPDDALTVDELCAFDNMHYHGTDALDSALRMLDVQAGQRWLEIGSGIGGPARYLAHRGGIRVTALELQADQNELAAKLSRRCGLESSVHHVCGNFLEHEFGGATFDSVVSWLALYHIPARPLMLQRCHSLLNPGGRFYTEDLYGIGDIDMDQRAALERDLYAITLPTLDGYCRDLQQAGFEIEHCDEMTADWAGFTQARLVAYRAQRERHQRVHGEAIVQALDDFYSAVDYHFQSGKLGGVRLCAKRRE
jgi:cyclopropane fatty-acyl-phospholipid synthase-like methyltransferase